MPIRTPPLRERTGDVAELADYFVRRYAETRTTRGGSSSDEAIEQLQSMPWKGNVRELKNLIERLLILSRGDTISRQDRAPGRGRSEQEMPHDLARRRP